MSIINTLKTGTALLASAVVLSSCVNLPKLKDQSFEPSTFERELAREYLEFSDSEARQYDWIDSDFFAKKGIKSLDGKDPQPELPSDWRTPDERLAELIQARQVLMQALTSENKQNKPVRLARAQKFYDCWIEQQEENWQPDHIAACRDKFIDAMAALGDKIDSKQIPYTIVEQATVYFEFDSAKVDGEAKEIIDGIVLVLNKLDSYKITLGGHTDTSGSDAYNERLAKRRADKVKAVLAKEHGVSSDRIVENAFGESRLKVVTKDGVKERKNRRVEIYVIE